MYQLNQEQIDEIEVFIGKIPDSMVKSHIEKWYQEVLPTERVTSEQLEKLLSFQNALPKELQSFPQSLAGWLKNREHTERREAKEGITETADLGTSVAQSIHGVPDQDAPDNDEDTLHKLGTKEKKKIKKKAVAKTKSKGKGK